MVYLYLFITSGLPVAVNREGLLFIESESGYAPIDGPIPESAIEWASTLLSTLPPAKLTPEIVSYWWEERTGAPAQIELLADDETQLSDGERERLSRLGDAGWAVNTAFVGFYREHSEARREAIELIRKSSLAEQ